MIEFPQHAPNPWFDTEGDNLLVGKGLLSSVARRAGRTPFYVYDRSVISRKVEILRRTLPDDIRIHYAVKANPMPAVIEHLRAIVDGMDVASAGELMTALACGVPARVISLAGPGKSDADLQAAVDAGVTINVESEGELQRLSGIARAGGRRPRVAIRVNPDFELKTSGMKMGGGPKQFGIDAERVPSVLDVLGGMQLEFVGFHIFSGSQNLRADAIVEAQRNTVELAVRLARSAPGPVRTLNIGGGFGIPYFPGEQMLDLAPIAAGLSRQLGFVHQHLPAAELVLELGRYLVGECGLYVCEVIDRKISRGHVFLVTNGGLHHHLAASGNFGQVIRKNYAVAVGNRMASKRHEPATVVGPLCTPLDLLADRVPLPEAVPGDLVVVFQSGAYGMTASPTRFLSHPEPAEIIV